MTTSVDVCVGEASPVVQLERGGVELVERLEPEWRALCEEGPNNEPFFRPEWIAAYLRTFMPPDRLLLVTARAEGKLTAVLPLVEERARFSGLSARKLVGTVELHCWRFDMARSAGAEGSTAAQAVWEYLRELPGWDMIEFPDVAQGGGLEAVLRAAEADGFPTHRWDFMQTPVLSLAGWDGSEDFFLRRVSANLRQNLNRITRKLMKQGPLVLRRYEHSDPELLRRFYEMESAGWKGKEGTAIANAEKRIRFYNDLAQTAERHGYLTLYFLEHAGKTLAIHYGLAYQNRYFMVRCAYDEHERQYAPGHLLLHAVLRDCAERGITEFDFIAHADEWKRKWTSTFRPHAILYIFRKGSYGRLLRFAKTSVNPLLKRILGREDEVPA
jgi:CelD/BcsL family acetyltransferase involved in cellulose biosynthesis